MGVDVHKEVHVACLYSFNEDNSVYKEIREFRTNNEGIRSLSEWAFETKVPFVVMESTGVYWRSLCTSLVSYGVPCKIVNAYHVKNLPGHKTDKKDAEWLAKITCAGLVKASFVPDEQLNGLRTLSKLSTTLTHELSAAKNRLNKILVENGVRLDLICSDIHGVTGRKLLGAILEGKSPCEAAQLAGRRLRASRNEIEQALSSNLGSRKIYVQKYYRQVLILEEEVRLAKEDLLEAAAPYSEYVDLLKTIPGISDISAIKILAETGIDMTQFETAARLSSWAGVSPGNNESAGKRKSGKTTRGNQRLKTYLCECAHAAVKTKSQLSLKFHKVCVRRGFKKAIGAVAHKIARIIFCMISRKETYREMPVDNRKGKTNKVEEAKATPLETQVISSPEIVGHQEKETTIVEVKAEKELFERPEVSQKVNLGTNAIEQPVEKRPVGRPKGSKKIKIGVEAVEQAVDKKPRGRPKGSGKKKVLL
jgi:transposase